jgi:histidinol-phosphate aminotransferase
MVRYNDALSRLGGHAPSVAMKLAAAGPSASGLTNLALNECSLGCSPHVIEAVRAAVPHAARYPATACGTLRQVLSQRLGVLPEQLVFGNGVFELLGLVTQAFVAPGREVVIPDPSFGWYRVATLAAGATIVPVPLADDTIDLDAVARAVTPRTALVWLCNPHNPMGTIVRDAPLRALLARVPAEVAVVIDEAYVEFARDAAFPDSIALLRQHPNLVVLRSFSKAYGLAGFRIGYGIASAETIAVINKVRTPPNVNHLAQVAAVAALEDTAFTARVQRVHDESVAAYGAVLRELRLRYIPTHANFIMIDLGHDADAVAAAFFAAGIVLRSGAEIGRPTWLRITFGTPEENTRVFAVLRDLVARGLARATADAVPQPA